MVSFRYLMAINSVAAMSCRLMSDGPPSLQVLASRIAGCRLPTFGGVDTAGELSS